VKKLLVLLSLCFVSFNLFANSQAQNADIAQSYFDAYIARDWQTLASYFDEEGSFADTTAKPVFGDVAVEGKEETLAYFTRNYASIKAMSFHSSRQWVSGDIAVFEGTLNWQLEIAENKVVDTQNMPFITILELKNGRVFRHRDYADYTPFLTAYAAVDSPN